MIKIFCFSPFGYEGALVTVEVDLRRGIPAIDMVGLADGAVRESRERMRAGIRNSGFDFPNERVLISLSPADVKKEGAGFDLAIALAVLIAMQHETFAEQETGAEIDDAILVIGELELTGKIRPVRGIHAAVSSAAENGITKCIVPAQNMSEASSCGISVCGADTLSDAFSACIDPGRFVRTPLGFGGNAQTVSFPPISADMDFSVIKNQNVLVRALQIAAAGKHHVLAFGPPGCGKTLALSRFPALLPYLTEQEARPVSRIHSLAGVTHDIQGLIRMPPFRAPHQSASLEGMTGGGTHCSPGEISLAHNGVLFLDEILEFKPHVLQSLRVPLETGTVTVSRAGKSAVYPARFILLAAANPCPCGNFGSRGKICLCSARSVEQYWKKISGPLLDRIDIRVPVFSPENSQLPAYTSSLPASALPKNFNTATSALRSAIARATAAQKERQNRYNSELLAQDIDTFCALMPDAEAELDAAALKYGLSLRSSASCRKIARTIADMAGSKEISIEHIQEAIFFRKIEGGMSFEFQ